MPVVDIETVGDAPTGTALGRLFGSERAGTWVRLRSLAPTHYAENDAPEASTLAATFVTVLQYAPPEGRHRRQQAREIASIVAEATHRSRKHVHVLFEPAGAGRIAFGGVLEE